MNDDPKVSEILARMDDKGALKPEDQQALCAHLGIGIRDLPLQMRGGLLGVFYGDKGSHPHPVHE